VRVKLVAPPLYVLTTAMLDQAKGIDVRTAPFLLFFKHSACCVKWSQIHT
jgi:hypothetical protein